MTRTARRNTMAHSAPGVSILTGAEDMTPGDFVGMHVITGGWSTNIMMLRVVAGMASRGFVSMFHTYVGWFKYVGAVSRGEAAFPTGGLMYPIVIAGSVISTLLCMMHYVCLSTPPAMIKETVTAHSLPRLTLLLAMLSLGPVLLYWTLWLAAPNASVYRNKLDSTLFFVFIGVCATVAQIIRVHIGT
jgi:hypothetical protein